MYVYHSGAISGSTHFSDDKFNTRIFGLDCSGTEELITECLWDDSSDCGQFSDAEVICQG